MPALGSNLSTIKDAESTDLSSLLNVLEWMKDAAFLGKTRVNVDLVRKLRSQVRNTWAHAPQQESTDDEKTEGFSIATDFLKNLEGVCPNTESVKCLQHLEYLRNNGVTNVVESELQNLLLLGHLLNDIKEEITNMKVEHSSDKNAIEEHQQKLMRLESALTGCLQKMEDFESFKENINKQFNNFAEELKLFHGIPDDIHEMRESIWQIRDDLAKNNKRRTLEPEPRSCLPDRLTIFTGRDAEIQNVITHLQDEKKAVVSIYGGPGFGKTAIAIEVSHKLSEDQNIAVVFSQLSTLTTVDEIIQQLCLDVGVNHEDDSKQSLILWLKNIKKKVILVMDNIDKLLEDQTSFYEFVRLLRKNSDQHCQIVTTSRMSFEIPELFTDQIQVDVMDEKACMEFLKKKCPEEDDKFFRTLAELCGHILLAMCIASSRIHHFKDSGELLQHLKNQPMNILKSAESDQYVKRAINMSYGKCSVEEQETFVRLSVFEGGFSEDAARAVIEKDDLETTDILKKLVSLSLIKEPTKQRYSVHLLIKHFLKDKQKCGDEQTKTKAERAREEAMRAKVLMVKHYLELGHRLTMKSYSKDGYKDNREALKQEASNIQNILKICCQQEDPTSSDISDCLAHSKIYTTSARLFSVFVRTITPRPVVDQFLQRCANLAKEKQQHAIKINFDCLLVAEERYNTIGKSDKSFISEMEKIKKEFKNHHDDLKKDNSLCAHYYYQDGRYLWRKSGSITGEEALHLQNQAREQLKKSLDLRKTLPETPEGKADNIFSLLQLGKMCAIIGETECDLNNSEASKTSFSKAEEYYREAIQLSESDLGGHELTSSCYKHSGDLFLATKEFDLAEKEYTTAKNMRENLGLDASEKYACILKNLGRCLIEITMYNRETRAKEAIEVLEKACDIIEKLPKSAKLENVLLPRAYASLAIAYDLTQKNPEAVDYANKAMEMIGRHEKIIPKHHYDKLLKISKKDNL